MPLAQIILLFAAGLAGGTVNAIAGGATFFTFPAMLAAGLPPVVANASNTVALWPASLTAALAERHELWLNRDMAKTFLGIGVVESRLDTSRFVRVHRSHIVNIGRVVAMRRIGDAGIIELAAREPYTVPVSRGRFTSLRSRLAATADDIDDGEAVALEPTFATQHR